MRIASALVAGQPTFGVVSGDRLHDLSAAFDDEISLLVTAATASGRPAVTSAIGEATPIPLAEVEFLPPIPRPNRILCVGTNYAEHVAESDRVARATEYPMLFTRFPSSLVGHGQPLVRPTSISANLDYEGELAVIIGRPTRYADRDQARAAIAGYSCLMDGTLRDYQRHTSQFTPGKNVERSGAWGPWIVTADEVPDPYALTLTTTVNGEIRQRASTRQLIFDLEEIICYCSQFTTLEPGDVIASGTPGGVGYARTPPAWLEPGDEVVVAIDGVGELSNVVVDEEESDVQAG